MVSWAIHFGSDIGGMFLTQRQETIGLRVVAMDGNFMMNTHGWTSVD